MSDGLATLKRFSHKVGKNFWHIAFATKYRYKMFGKFKQHNLVLACIRRVCKNHNIKIHTLYVMPDHVHLFISFPPNVLPTYVFAVLKAKTAGALFRNFRWLREIFRKGHFWSSGKFYRSVGNVTYDVIQNYIRYSQGNWKTNFSNLPSFYQQRKLSTFVA